MLPLSLSRACSAPRLATTTVTMATAAAKATPTLRRPVQRSASGRPPPPSGTRRRDAATTVVVAASTSSPGNNHDAADADDESLLDSSGEFYESCSPGYVTVDNASSPTCTKLHLEAQDYIGLTRVVAWVLGGLGLHVRDARLTTGEDGWAKNEFWVTTEAGSKLSDRRAQAASERLAEFVTYCTPPPRRAGEEPRCEAGGIRVDSSARAHDRWTVVTVRGGGLSSNDKSGGRSSGSGGGGSSSSGVSPLLDVASAVSGAGIEIREAVIQGGPSTCGGVGGGGGGDRPTIDEDPEDGEEEGSSSSSPSSSSSSSSATEPAMRLWVCEPATGGKLSYVRCAALLQTLSLALGRGGGPSLVPPAPVTLLGGGGNGRE